MGIATGMEIAKYLDWHFSRGFTVGRERLLFEFELHPRTLQRYLRAYEDAYVCNLVGKRTGRGFVYARVVI